MSKAEVITAIRRRNHGITEDFLSAFPVRHLADYLARLDALQGAQPAGYASWTRTSASPAIAWRRR